MAEVMDFLFAEFAAGAPVEVLRPGTFVDRNGNTVEVSEKDLETFMLNFSTGAAGQEVPIDVNHEKGEAAGWVRELRLEGEHPTSPARIEGVSFEVAEGEIFGLAGLLGGGKTEVLQALFVPWLLRFARLIR